MKDLSVGGHDPQKALDLSLQNELSLIFKYGT
jgi:hypothetical protein